MKRVLAWVLAILTFALCGYLFATACYWLEDAIAQDDPKPQPVFDCLKLNEVKLTSQYWVMYPSIKGDTIKRDYTPQWWEAWDSLQGQGFWLGYDRGGFDWPKDVYIYGQLWLPLEDGKEPRQVLFYFSKQTPDRFYILPFVSIQPYADSNGKHFGSHPCAAYVVKLEYIKPLLPDMVAAVEKLTS